MSRMYCVLLLQILSILIIPDLITGFNIRQNSLQNIIASRAIVKTVIEKIDAELVTENTLVNEVSKVQYNPHIDEVFYITVVMCAVYGLFIYTATLNEKTLMKYEKINNI